DVDLVFVGDSLEVVQLYWGRRSVGPGFGNGVENGHRLDAAASDQVGFSTYLHKTIFMTRGRGGSTCVGLVKPGFLRRPNWFKYGDVVRSVGNGPNCSRKIPVIALSNNIKRICPESTKKCGDTRHLCTIGA